MLARERGTRRAGEGWWGWGRGGGGGGGWGGGVWGGLARHGGPSPRRIDEATRAKVVALAAASLQGARRGTVAEHGASSAPQPRAHPARGGRASPKQRRAPRTAVPERMPRAGMPCRSWQPRDWLEGRGRLTLVGGIDDATGALVAATSGTRRRAPATCDCSTTPPSVTGCPRIYRDRHGSLEPRPHVGRRGAHHRRWASPTHVGRALAELGIGRPAGSPRPGRIERCWGTTQGRLPLLLRRAGADDRLSANAVLADWLPRFNRLHRAAADGAGRRCPRA